MMEELKNLDWSCNIRDGQRFIRDDNWFKNSATFRIITDTFTNPFLSDDDEDRENPRLKTHSKKKLPKEKKAKNYVPGLNSLPIYPKSALGEKEHFTCIQVLCSSNKNCISMPEIKINQDDVVLYNRCLQVIKEEQRLFNDHVSGIWKSKLCVRQLKMIYGHNKFVEEIWRRRLKDIKKYSPFYQLASMLPLVYSNSSNPIKIEELELLQNCKSSLPEIFVPTLNKMFCVTKNCDKLINKYENFKSEKNFVVSKDETCAHFALKHGVNIVISSSSLKHLANNYPPYSRSWYLPVKVEAHKSIDLKGKPIIHTIVYIDHALPPNNLTLREKTQWCFKHALKQSFLKSENLHNAGLSEIETPESCHDPQDKKSPDNSQNIPKDVDFHSLPSDDDEDALVMDVDESEIDNINNKGVVTRGMAYKVNEPNISPENQTRKRKLSSQSNNSVHSPCSRKMRLNMADDINGLSISDNKQTLEDLKTEDFTYSLWKLGKSDPEAVLSKTAENDIRIIVRSKADGCSEEQMCHLEPKIEYQYEYGSECITPSEAAIQWTSLQFLPNSKLVRVRMMSHNTGVTMFEKFSLQNFQSECTKQTIWKTSMALNSFFNVFSSLSKLYPGEYMLGHEKNHGAFAVLYKNVPQKCENGLDLYKTFDIDPSEIVMNQVAPWIPIDPTIVTPNLFHHRVMPCMFNPNATKFIKLPKEKKKTTEKKKEEKEAKGSKYLKIKLKIFCI